mmetsp:Transcript_3604/g.6844  ORF Transcript_3604/g.6844 Transcript_3604/m.6844 type:complete len:120 (-) Transcript_3604:1072-1431(-)
MELGLRTSLSATSLPDLGPDLLSPFKSPVQGNKNALMFDFIDNDNGGGDVNLPFDLPAQTMDEKMSDDQPVPNLPDPELHANDNIQLQANREMQTSTFPAQGFQSGQVVVDVRITSGNK